MIVHSRNKPLSSSCSRVKCQQLGMLSRPKSKMKVVHKKFQIWVGWVGWLSSFKSEVIVVKEQHPASNFDLTQPTPTPGQD